MLANARSHAVPLGIVILFSVAGIAIHAMTGDTAGQVARPRDTTASAQPRAGATVLTGGWLIDGTGKPAVENAWLRIEGTRIVAVGQGAPPAAAGAQVIDLKGRTVLPGLSDMHAHVGELEQARWMLKLLLAYGVTNVRDTGNALGNLAAVRRWMASEDALPHLYVSGAVFPGNEMEANLELMKAGPRLRSLLEEEAAFGVDFIKFHNWISFDALKQIAAFSKAHNLHLIGHVPVNITSLAAIDAGMTVLEHIRLRAWEVIDDPEIIARYPIDLYVRDRELFWAYFDPNGQVVKRTVEGWVKRRDQFFFNPTLVINEGGSHYYEPSYDAWPERRLVSAAIEQQWQNAPVRRANLTADQRAESKRAHQGHLAFMRLVRAAGIRVLTGTDTPIPFVIPGVSLHRELELLVEAGYSPLEAIQASTATAAECFRTKERGLLVPGQDADLVIARGNVAADIRALKDIERVMVGGRLHDRARLLEEAARFAAAHHPRTN